MSAAQVYERRKPPQSVEGPSSSLAGLSRRDGTEGLDAALRGARRKEKPFRYSDATWEQVELAHAQGLTGVRMTKEFGVSRSAVSRALGILGLKPNGTFGMSHVSKRAYRMANKRGLTRGEAAAELGVTVRSVAYAWSAMALPAPKARRDKESRAVIERGLDNGERVQEIAGKAGLSGKKTRERAKAIYAKRLNQLGLNIIPGPNYDLRRCAAILVFVPDLVRKEGLRPMEGKVRYYMMNFGLSSMALEKNIDLLKYPLTRIRPRLEYFSKLREDYADRMIAASGAFSDPLGLFRKTPARKMRQLLNCNDEGFIDALRHTTYTRSANAEEYQRFKRKMLAQLRREGRVPYTANHSSDIRS